MSVNINDCVLNNHTECGYDGVVLERYHKLFRKVITYILANQTNQQELIYLFIL